MFIHEILNNTKELIKAGWCKGHAAEKKDGAFVSPYHKDACKFCLQGAIERAVGYNRDLILFIFEEFKQHLEVKSLPSWNDAYGRTQEEVVELLETASKWNWDARYHQRRIRTTHFHLS